MKRNLRSIFETVAKRWRRRPSVMNSGFGESMYLNLSGCDVEYSFKLATASHYCEEVVADTVSSLFITSRDNY